MCPFLQTYWIFTTSIGNLEHYEMILVVFFLMLLAHSHWTRWWVSFFSNTYSFIYAYVCVPHLCRNLGADKRGHQVPWKWSYKKLRAAIWVSGTKPGSSTSTGNVLILWAISSGPWWSSLHPSSHRFVYWACVVAKVGSHVSMDRKPDSKEVKEDVNGDHQQSPHINPLLSVIIVRALTTEIRETNFQRHLICLHSPSSCNCLPTVFI